MAFLKFTSLESLIFGWCYFPWGLFHSFQSLLCCPHYLVWKRPMEGALSECLSLRLNGNVQSKESWNSWWDDCIRQDIFTQPFTISSLSSRKNTLFLLWESPWNSLFLKKKHSKVKFLSSNWIRPGSFLKKCRQFVSAYHCPSHVTPLYGAERRNDWWGSPW